jgi:glutamate racemase
MGIRTMRRRKTETKIKERKKEIKIKALKKEVLIEVVYQEIFHHRQVLKLKILIRGILNQTRKKR